MALNHHHLLGWSALAIVLSVIGFRSVGKHLDRETVRNHLLLERLPDSIRNVKCTNVGGPDYLLYCGFEFEPEDIESITRGNIYRCTDQVENRYRLLIQDRGVLNQAYLGLEYTYCSGTMWWCEGRAQFETCSNEMRDIRERVQDAVQLAYNADEGVMLLHVIGD